MRDRKSFLIGIATAIFGLSFVFFGWVSLQLHRSLPIVKLNPDSKNYTAPSQRAVYTATRSLNRLYYLSKLLGLETYAAKSMIGLAKASSLRNDPKMKVQTTFLHLQSLEEAEKLVLNRQGQIESKVSPEPLVEAYVNYSQFLKSQGEKKQALKTLRRAKKLVEGSSGEKSSLEAINTALHQLNAS